MRNFKQNTSLLINNIAERIWDEFGENRYHFLVRNCQNFARLFHDAIKIQPGEVEVPESERHLWTEMDEPVSHPLASMSERVLTGGGGVGAMALYVGALAEIAEAGGFQATLIAETAGVAGASGVAGEAAAGAAATEAGAGAGAGTGAGAGAVGATGETGSAATAGTTKAGGASAAKGATGAGKAGGAVAGKTVRLNVKCGAPTSPPITSWKQVICGLHLLKISS